jgi:hypothetical protein
MFISRQKQKFLFSLNGVTVIMMQNETMPVYDFVVKTDLLFPLAALINRTVGGFHTNISKIAEKLGIYIVNY